MYRVQFVDARAAGRLPDRVNVLSTDFQRQGEYLSGYRVRVGDDLHSFHFRDANIDEKRGGRTPSPDADSVVVVVPGPRPSS